MCVKKFKECLFHEIAVTQIPRTRRNVKPRRTKKSASGSRNKVRSRANTAVAPSWLYRQFQPVRIPALGVYCQLGLVGESLFGLGPLQIRIGVGVRRGGGSGIRGEIS